MSTVLETTAPVAAPVVVVDDETRDTLRKAKELLTNGWCQGELQDGDSHCVVGAIGVASGGHIAYGCVYHALGSLYRMSRAFDALGMNGGEIAKWNDTPGRTQAEVIDRFDKALAA